MLLEREINVTQLSNGRFGTSIASLADLNGDGLRDVAVGAPLEDANAGAVYIYFGDRHQGMRRVYSQVRHLVLQRNLNGLGDWLLQVKECNDTQNLRFAFMSRFDTSLIQKFVLFEL